MRKTTILFQALRGFMLWGIASCDTDGPGTVTPTCSDGIKNGAETDVDCGGGTCGKCTNQKACTASTDCSGGLCTNKICETAPTCVDAKKNGAETDVDCGGGTCGKCIDQKACLAPTDCQSGICSTQVCTAPSCTDLVKNGSETDVDCGGGCKPCGPSLACMVSADCSTGLCKQASCQYAANCKEFLTANPTLPDGMYLIDPDGAGTIAPLLVRCDMTTRGGGWTLVGKGREGWNWKDTGEGTADDVANNPTTNSVAYLDSAVVAAIVGNPNFLAWGSSLRIHRDGGFNDDYEIRPNAATPFKWSLFEDSRHGCGGPAVAALNGTVNASASPLGLQAFQNTNVDLKDLQNTGNDCTRMFTARWTEHACKGGWSTGSTCTPTAPVGITNCWMNTNEGHCIPPVRVWVRD